MNSCIVPGTTDLGPGSATSAFASLWTFARGRYSILIRRIFVTVIFVLSHNQNAWSVSH